MVKSYYLQSYKYFHEYRDDVLTLFEFDGLTRRKVDELARKLFKWVSFLAYCKNNRSNVYFANE